MEAGPKSREKVDARVIEAKLALGINAMRADVLAQIRAESAKILAAKDEEIRSLKQEIAKLTGSLTREISDSGSVLETQNRFEALPMEEDDPHEGTSASKDLGEEFTVKKRRKNNTPKKLEVENGNSKEEGASSDASRLLQKAVPAGVSDPITAIFERKVKPKAVAPVVAKAPAVEQPKKVSTPPKQEGEKLTARIKVVNLDAVKFADHCKGKGIAFRLSRDRSGATTISCKAEQRLELLAFLKGSNYEGHSYLTKEDRYHSRVLKNVDSSFGAEYITEEIKAKLEKLAIAAPVFKVDQLETARSVSEGAKLPIYIVKAKSKEVMDAIMAIPCIGYARPRWENQQRPEITQCHNCYELGHSMLGECFHPRQCKRCLATGKDHVCTIQKVPKVDAKGKPQNEYKNFRCCKCKEFGHPPTWSGCPYKQRKLEEIRKQRDAKLTAIQTRINPVKYQAAPLPKTTVWAPLPQVGVAPVQKEIPATPAFAGGAKNFLEEEVMKLFGFSMEEFQNRTSRFIASYRQVTDIEAKKSMLLNYMLSTNGFSP